MMIDSIRLIGGDSVVICPFVCLMQLGELPPRRAVISSTPGYGQKRVASMANKQKPWWYIVCTRKHRQHRWASDELFVPWARKPPVAEFCWVWSLECWVAWQLKDREPWPMIHQVWICSNLKYVHLSKFQKCYLCLCPIYVWFEIYLMANVYCFQFAYMGFPKAVCKPSDVWRRQTVAPQNTKPSISRQCFSSMFTQHWKPILRWGIWRWIPSIQADK